jgi:hypothetical protein
MTDRQFGLYMYCGLTKQGFEWMHVFKDANDDIQKEVKYTYKKSKKLIEKIESALGQEMLERFWEDSEVFSKTLELIAKAPTKKDKEFMFLLLKEYVNGQLKIIEDIPEKKEDEK